MIPIDDDEVDEARDYPRLSWLSRWLSGQGEGRVVHPQVRVSNPLHDYHGKKPDRENTGSIRELLGEEYFKAPPKVKKLDATKLKYGIDKIAKAMGRSSNQVRHWESPPPGRKQRLPRAHRSPGGYRKYTEAEFNIILEWARRERLMETQPDGTVIPHVRPLDNWAARVADAIEMVRDPACPCGGCREPRREGPGQSLPLKNPR